jgi:SAM-dependent methyltransferase
MTSTARYDDYADWYHDWVGDDVSEPAAAAVLAAAGDVDGQRVLDFACGSGRVARALARSGAEVVGIDVSEKLIALARANTDSDLGIRYLVADASTPGWRDIERFDGVVSNMALMDIDDLDGAIASVASVLVPHGWFVFSIFHPCFPGFRERLPSWPATKTYFDEQWWNTAGVGVRGRVGVYHRILSTYLNALVQAGFSLESFAEPSGATEHDGTPIPVPFWLVVRCRLG